MPLPQELRWLDPMLDVLVDELLHRQAVQEAAAPVGADATALQAAT